MNKRSSSAGQDLRMPMLGGNKPPTDDSKAYAKSLLSKGQREAEKMTRGSGPTVRDITPHVSHSRAGSLPKLGSANEYNNDPLVQYLKKHGQSDAERTAGKDWPKGSCTHQGNQLEDNLHALPKGDTDTRLKMEDPQATTELKEEGIDHWQGFLRGLFDNRTPPRAKCHEKDHPPTVGEVDALLKKFS